MDGSHEAVAPAVGDGARFTDLVELAGGTFEMGSAGFYPEEAPVRAVTVAPFAIERHPVTNGQFAQFVAATGYVTVAERPLNPTVYPQVPQRDLLPGALVFRATPAPVDLRDWRQWWDWVPGACWRHPFGPGSDVAALSAHPVVQVAYPDAAAFAAWAGRRLPSEAEWEYAAHAGTATAYAWGDVARPGGVLMANTWQGSFPHRNDGASGWAGTSPVGVFPPNGFGLLDMIGNVWEWTTTPFGGPPASRRRTETAGCCPTPAEPDPAEPDPAVPMTLKGGSHLCAPEYCHRYRPAARSSQSQDSATTHIGFRCVVST